MSVELLDKLFGSSVRVKILRLFLLNRGAVFPFADIVRRANVRPIPARKEMRLLESLGFVKRRKGTAQDLISLKNGEVATRGVKKSSNKKIDGYQLNELFPLIVGLKGLVLNASPMSRITVGSLARSAGKVKLLIVAGFLVQDDASRVDLLVVGDSLKRAPIDKAIAAIEADAGREITYAVLTTQEFNYRLEMSDKFIRDVLDFPHEKIVNKLGV